MCNRIIMQYSVPAFMPGKTMPYAFVPELSEYGMLTMLIRIDSRRFIRYGK
ncbi:MAG: hypothetical protein IJ480_03930 [Clostridia bacterium]|nr:hypothetical protein [Clostridia bacterium]